jgi:MFS family permease
VHLAGILIVGRLVMGVGAAASEPGTLSLIRHIYPKRAERARALGVWAAVSGLALALGPVIGGVLADGPGWRSIFWFGFGFGALSLGVAAVTLTESKDPEGRRLDVPGLVTGACAITAATFAVIGGENRGYGTWWIDGLFVLSAVLVAQLRDDQPQGQSLAFDRPPPSLAIDPAILVSRPVQHHGRKGQDGPSSKSRTRPNLIHSRLRLV